MVRRTPAAAGNSPLRQSDKRVSVTDQDNDVTTSVAGANGWETIFDLSPDTDIYYWLLKSGHPQIGSDGDYRLRMQLPQDGGGSTEIGDNASVRLIAQDPTEEDTDQLGRVFQYREFSQADQFSNEDVVRLQLDRNVQITEAAHLKVQVDNSTNGNDVDLSQSGGYLSLESHRGVER